MDFGTILAIAVAGGIVAFVAGLKNAKKANAKKKEIVERWKEYVSKDVASKVERKSGKADPLLEVDYELEKRKQPQEPAKVDDNPFRTVFSMMDNYEEIAFKSYKQAADAGDAKAQYDTAGCYERGFGVEKDYAKARMYYAMASMQGHIFATYSLGLLYYYGNGGEQDFDKAFSYFSSAASTGNSNALVALSVCYEMGRGVKQDAEEAEKLMKKAVSQPDAPTYMLDSFANDMRGAEIKQSVRG